jgi:hypothetical protein
MRMGKKKYNLLDADSNSTLNKIPGLKLKKLKAKSAKKFETEESATLELQCLVLTEQLKTTRIQRIYYLDKLKKSGRVIEKETLQLDGNLF